MKNNYKKIMERYQRKSRTNYFTKYLVGPIRCEKIQEVFILIKRQDIINFVHLNKYNYDPSQLEDIFCVLMINLGIGLHINMCNIRIFKN